MATTSLDRERAVIRDKLRHGVGQTRARMTTITKILLRNQVSVVRISRPTSILGGGCRRGEAGELD